MRELSAVDLDFIDSAPIRVHLTKTVRAPVGATFTAITSDPSGWGHWLPGFSTASEWVSAPPHGVGSRRTMRAFGSSFEETVLAWNVDDAFAFRVDRCAWPAVRGMAERWSVRAVGHDSTELTWSLAVDSSGPSVVMRAFYSSVNRVLIGIAARRLAPFIGSAGDAPDQKNVDLD
ncbi:SRPBCC family protein [Mycobacterium sp. NPDC048908]|uniref:SRPBCC family protein n=1 Tax=Mycobacterium sp. NPDC048908 TaxID=3364292 RepID=UPI00371A0851